MLVMLYRSLVLENLFITSKI